MAAMSPLEAEILLWYKSRAAEYPKFVNGEATEFYLGLLNQFLDDGLLTVTGSETNVCANLKLTLKGHCLVDAMLSLPMPENKWVMP